jgi:hypothetical protein
MREYALLRDDDPPASSHRAFELRDSNIAGIIDLLQALAGTNVDHGVKVAGTNI